MLAGNRGKVMKNCKKMIVLIMVFALCFGLSACVGGSSDGYDAADSEDYRGSGENESVVYGSTDDGQDKECVYRNMKSLRLMIVTIRLPRGIGILTETGTV